MPAFGCTSAATRSSDALSLARMNILAFDTCFVSCSAAVYLAAGEVARNADQFELMEKGHSERIVPMIAAVLGKARLAIEEIGSFAVTVGPGSFTGARTGIAVARALALATGKPVRGTSSLHVMAAGLRERRPVGAIAIAVSTRDGLVYFQTFDGPDTQPTSAPCVTSPRDAVDALRGMPHMVAGAGASLVVAAADATRDRFELIDEPVDAQARVLALMALQLPILTPPRPLYLREPDAKPQSGVLIQRQEPSV